MTPFSKSQPNRDSEDLERILCASEEVTPLPGSSKCDFQSFPCGSLDIGRDVDLLNYDFGRWPLSDSADLSSIVPSQSSRRNMNNPQSHLAPRSKTSARRHKDSSAGVDPDTPDLKGVKELAAFLHDACATKSSTAINACALKLCSLSRAADAREVEKIIKPLQPKYGLSVTTATVCAMLHKGCADALHTAFSFNQRTTIDSIDPERSNTFERGKKNDNRSSPANRSYNESVRSSDNSGLNGQKPPLRPGELKSQAGNLAAQPLHCEQPLKQTDVRSAEPKLQPKSRELEPQEPRYQEPQSQESLLQATSRLQESPSQESPPQATHLQESSSQEFPPQESPPQESPPQKSSPQAPRCQESAPQESAPQESAPQESAPQESAPQESFIRESHLKQPDVQPAVSKLQSESKGSQASESHPIDQPSSPPIAPTAEKLNIRKVSIRSHGYFYWAFSSSTKSLSSPPTDPWPFASEQIPIEDGYLFMHKNTQNNELSTWLWKEGIWTDITEAYSSDTGNVSHPQLSSYVLTFNTKTGDILDPSYIKYETWKAKQD